MNKKALSLFSLVGAVYYGWLTHHYWSLSLEIQRSFFPTWKIYTITWLQEMGLVCSVFTFIFTILFIVVYPRVNE